MVLRSGFGVQGLGGLEFRGYLDYMTLMILVVAMAMVMNCC